jgi:hypothetical protein
VHGRPAAVGRLLVERFPERLRIGAVDVAERQLVEHPDGEMTQRQIDQCHGEQLVREVDGHVGRELRPERREAAQIERGGERGGDAADLPAVHEPAEQRADRAAEQHEHARGREAARDRAQLARAGEDRGGQRDEHGENAVVDVAGIRGRDEQIRQEGGHHARQRAAQRGGENAADIVQIQGQAQQGGQPVEAEIDGHPAQHEKQGVFGQKPFRDRIVAAVLHRLFPLLCRGRGAGLFRSAQCARGPADPPAAPSIYRNACHIIVIIYAIFVCFKAFRAALGV